MSVLCTSVDALEWRATIMSVLCTSTSVDASEWRATSTCQYCVQVLMVWSGELQVQYVSIVYKC